MAEYKVIKGIFQNGKIKLLENETEIREHQELLVIIPLNLKRGIQINDFLKKGDLISLGGDAVEETEALYSD